MYAYLISRVLVKLRAHFFLEFLMTLHQEKLASKSFLDDSLML